MDQNEVRTYCKTQLYSIWTKFPARYLAPEQRKMENWMLCWDGAVLQVYEREILIAEVKEDATIYLAEKIKHIYQFPFEFLKKSID